MEVYESSIYNLMKLLDGIEYEIKYHTKEIHLIMKKLDTIIKLAIDMKNIFKGAYFERREKIICEEIEEQSAKIIIEHFIECIARAVFLKSLLL